MKLSRLRALLLAACACLLLASFFVPLADARDTTSTAPVINTNTAPAELALSNTVVVANLGTCWQDGCPPGSVVYSACMEGCTGCSSQCLQLTLYGGCIEKGCCPGVCGC